MNVKELRKALQGRNKSHNDIVLIPPGDHSFTSQVNIRSAKHDDGLFFIEADREFRAKNLADFTTYLHSAITHLDRRQIFALVAALTKHLRGSSL
jgi:hypothetical protein